MSKHYRVKRYYGKNAGVSRAKPRVITVVFVVLLLVGLGYVGTILYGPINDFVMGLGTAPPPVIDMQSELESESEAESEPEPEPEPEPAPVHEALRIAYTSDLANIDAFISKIAGTTDHNAVMIDIKTPAGDVMFKTKNEMANKWNVVSPDAVDLKALASKLESKGLKLVAKMSVFRDPKAASGGRLPYAINYQDSGFLWLDDSPEKGGRPWLNPYSIPTQEYITSLADEAFDAGVQLLVLENLQFPDNSGVYATFGNDAAAMSRTEILEATEVNLQTRAKEKGARVAVTFPVTAVTRTDGEQNRYGGSILKTAGAYLLLNVSPSQFGASFSQNNLEIIGADENPAEAVKTAVDYVQQGVGSETEIIPMVSGEGTDALRGLGYEEYCIQY